MQVALRDAQSGSETDDQAEEDDADGDEGKKGAAGYAKHRRAGASSPLRGVPLVAVPLVGVLVLHCHAMGAFGVGFGFKNPATQVAKMWHELFFEEAEFEGQFAKIVFAIEPSPGGTSKDGVSDIDVFRKEFSPSNISKTTYR